MSHAQPLSPSDQAAAELARERRIAQMDVDEVRRDLATYTLPSPRSYATSDNYALLSAMPRLDLERSGEDPLSLLEAEAEIDSSSRGVNVGDSSRPELSSLTTSNDGSRRRPDTSQPRIALTSQHTPGHRTPRRVAPESLYPYGGYGGRSNAGERQRRPISPTTMDMIFSGRIFSSYDRPHGRSDADELQRRAHLRPGRAEDPAHGRGARPSPL